MEERLAKRAKRNKIREFIMEEMKATVMQQTRLQIQLGGHLIEGFSAFFVSHNNNRPSLELPFTADTAKSPRHRQARTRCTELGTPRGTHTHTHTELPFSMEPKASKFTLDN